MSSDPIKSRLQLTPVQVLRQAREDMSTLTRDILEVLEARGPDDRCHHRLLRQGPSEGDLSHAHTLLLSDLLDPINLEA